GASRNVRRGREGTTVACLAAVAVTLASAECRARGTGGAPRAEITLAPPADTGGPALLATIARRAVGARAGHTVVVLPTARGGGTVGRGGGGWAEPARGHPYTAIGSEGAWKSSPHLGTEYAAPLVDPSYVPPASTEVLPREGPGIVAAVVVPGDASKRPVRH